MCCRSKTPQLAPVESLGAIPALQKYYDAKVYPVEKRHLFAEFYTPGFTQAELEGKPIILLLGQYSVGKTSLIEYLCNGRYPGADIGPEPTTDVFAHIQYSENPTTIDGATLAQDKTYPLKGVEMFGEKFLNKFRSVNFNAEILQHVSIMDTPGILAGRKQTDARGYDFAAVISFLAERVDKILLMFDANKTDLSDEYKDVIKSLDGHSEKVRIMLNKCDSIKPRELIHVRGALMWSLGKIFSTPEVPKVYIGSFWKYLPARNQMSKTMQEDTDMLIKEICDLANTCKGRRINDVVKRAKQVRTHAYLIDEIRRSQWFFDMPVAVNRKKLAKRFAIVQKKYRIVQCDLPDEEDFQQRALKTDGKDWRKLDKQLTKLINSFLTDDVTKIVALANKEPLISVQFKLAERVEKPPEEAEWKSARGTPTKSTQKDKDKKSTDKKETLSKEKAKENNNGDEKTGDKDNKKKDKTDEKEKAKEKEEEKPKESPNKKKAGGGKEKEKDKEGEKEEEKPAESPKKQDEEKKEDADSKTDAKPEPKASTPKTPKTPKTPSKDEKKAEAKKEETPKDDLASDKTQMPENKDETSKKPEAKQEEAQTQMSIIPKTQVKKAPSEDKNNNEE